MNYDNMKLVVEEMQEHYKPAHQRSDDDEPTYMCIDDAITEAAERLQDLGFDDDDFNWDELRTQITRHSVSGEWADETYITFENNHEDLEVELRRDETNEMLERVWETYHFLSDEISTEIRNTYHGDLARLVALAEHHTPDDSIKDSLDDIDDFPKLAEYIEHMGFDDIAEAMESFQEASTGYGSETSGPDFAQQLCEDIGIMTVEPSEHIQAEFGRWPFSCIDWERAWEELQMDDYFRTESGNIYRNV